MRLSIFVGMVNKGGKQDLEKAKHYIDMIIERDYGDETQKSQVFTPSIETKLIS